MNLLIYITALLLCLSALSYQAIGRYKNEHYIRTQWDLFLHQETLCGFNRKVESAYEKDIISRLTSGSDRQEENKKASAEMNFRFFANAAFSAENPALAEQYIALGKKLLHLIYEKQQFFQTALDKNSNLLDNLFDALKEANTAAKIKLVKNLPELPLDEEMREFWINLCKECAMEVPALNELPKKQGCQKLSFLTFLTDKPADKIRVYLAPPLLLIALYDDIELVKDIMKTRMRLFNQRLKTKDNAEASREFQSLFSGRSSFEPLLDFSVTGTKPSQ